MLSTNGVIVDLLFASSGIEPEIVRSAELIEVIDNLAIRTATLPHLVATKVLARDDRRRPQDRIDLARLLAVASATDIEQARNALRLIEARGYARGKNLLGDLQSAVDALST